MKKKKETPFLDFYKECMTKGRLYGSGLCGCFFWDYKELYDMVQLFRPTTADALEYHRVVGYDSHLAFMEEFWAADSIDDMFYGFGPTRQTIVLFCAAMNDEL
jgi:hypothetical protein